jgi:hypothetical protein
MERVQVWIDKIRVTIEKRQEGEREYEIRCMHFPAEKTFLGECEATPDAVAELAGVHVYYATQALKMGGFLISTEPCEVGYYEYYLVALPAGVKRHPLL